MSDSDGMTPEELESLYFGPSAGSGPEAGWQPPRVPPPPPPESEREPPVWRDAADREKDEDRARLERLVRDSERAALGSQQAVDNFEANREAIRLEHDEAMRKIRKKHERDLKEIRRKFESDVEARLRDQEAAHPAASLQPPSLPARRPFTPLPALGSFPQPAPFDRATVFVVGFAAGALGATLCFAIRDWWRVRQRRR